jgi:hypothetical protein
MPDMADEPGHKLPASRTFASSGRGTAHSFAVVSPQPNKPEAVPTYFIQGKQSTHIIKRSIPDVVIFAAIPFSKEME